MQFEKRMHFARAHRFFTAPPDAGELIAERFAVTIGAGIGPVLRMDPRKYTRGQHGGRKAGAFFIGEIGNNDGMFRANAQIIEASNDL